jgi:Sulfotransferase domain
VALKVVGAGVGRTGTNSLKLALEQLLGGPCHHMFEIVSDPTQIPLWTAAIEGGMVDWSTMPPGYLSLVDWPGASFWPELTAANPDALVLLSVRDPEAWYRSASNSIFLVFDVVPPEMQPWFESMRRLLGERFSDKLDDPTAMMDAFERHNAAVRAAIPSSRLLEWTPTDGWEPICERLGLAVPDEPFPKTNALNDWRANFGMPPLLEAV